MDITGTIVDAKTSKPISGIVIVDLEASQGDYSVVAQTFADANGNFTFKNPASGKSYAVVISAESGGEYYVPAIIAGGGAGAPSSAPWATSNPIVPGSKLGTIPLTLPAAPTTAQIGQPVTSQNGTGMGTAVTAVFSLYEMATNWQFVIPFPSLQTPALTTGKDPTCDMNTDCGAITLTVSAFGVQYSGFNSGGVVFTQAPSPPQYNVVADAYQPNTIVPDCNPTRQASTAANLMAGQKVTDTTIQFTGCQ